MIAPDVSAEVAEAASVIRQAWSDVPRAGIVLGTGLGSLADHIEIEAAWPYHQLPHFARSTADGHRGRWLCGRLNGVPIVAMDGRFHLYEGYSFDQVTFPIRVMSAIKTQRLIVSNASGGLNPDSHPGDIVLVEDHINLMGRFGIARQPHRSRTQSNSHFRSSQNLYDPDLLALAERISAEDNVAMRRGTYIAMLGPNYETRAEYRWLRTLGDVVGMSTVPEVLVAAELGLPTIVFSMVANVFRSDDIQQTTSEDVVRSVSQAEPKLRRLVTQLLTRMPPI